MALRHLFAFALFLPLTLFSAPSDFKACQLKYQVSSVNLGHTQAFAINDQYALFYSKDEPSQSVAKRDPFLGLNLIKSPKRFRHSFKFYNHLPKKIAGVLPRSVREGKILSSQLGLTQLATFSKSLKTNALVSDESCGIMGIATPEGVIEREYIRHFLGSEKIVYGDAGIRLIDKNGVCVNTLSPFFKTMPFALGDVILYMDGKKAESAAQVSREILLSKPKSKHFFVVMRDKKKTKLKAQLQNRLGGGLLSDSFLETFGFSFEEDLTVQKDNAKYAVKKGDKLVVVLGESVKNLEDVRLALSQENLNETTPLLFRRNGFDFFIHLLKP